MNLFEQVLTPYMQPPQPEPQDYRDQEGYLCCGICHTRKEYEVSFGGELRRVPVACKHVQQIREKEDQALKKRQRVQMIKDRISEWSSWGAAIIPKATFSQDDGKSPDTASKIKGYANHFEKASQNNLGLMIYGAPGTGKTFYAEAVANTLVENAYFAWMTSIRLLSSAINQNYQQLRPALMQGIRNADLLILDDFGAERDTSYMAEQVFEIINARYESGKPLVVTTNLDPKVMASEKDISARRVYERVMEMCAPLEVKGQTRRSQIAARKMADLKDILGLEA